MSPGLSEWAALGHKTSAAGQGFPAPGRVALLATVVGRGVGTDKPIMVRGPTEDDASPERGKLR